MILQVQYTVLKYVFSISGSQIPSAVSTASVFRQRLQDFNAFWWQTLSDARPPLAAVRGGKWTSRLESGSWGKFRTFAAVYFQVQDSATTCKENVSPFLWSSSFSLYFHFPISVLIRISILAPEWNCVVIAVSSRKARIAWQCSRDQYSFKIVKSVTMS